MSEIADYATMVAINDNIASEHYFTAQEGVLGEMGTEAEAADMSALPSGLEMITFCVLVLKNGYMVTGDSYCMSQENMNAEHCRSMARYRAAEKIWPLMNYELRSQQRLQDISKMMKQSKNKH